MHILHTAITINRAHGGTASMIARLCSAETESGTRVTLATTEPYQEKLCFELNRQVGTLTLPKHNTIRSLNAWCAAEKVTVIHNHGLWSRSSHVAARLACMANIPLITTAHGMLRPWALAHKRWKKILGWHLYQARDLNAAKVLHATCEAERIEIEKLRLSPPSVTIPIGLDLPPAPSGTQPRCQTPRIALFIGRIHPVKGLEMLIEAVATLRPANWHFILAGPDEDRHSEKLRSLIDKHSLESLFSFPGPVNETEKANLLQRASLFILPSFTENFGIVVGEALSYEVPVLTTTGTPWHELIKARCGWVVQPNIEAITAGLQAALSTPNEELTAMGGNGRKLIESRYRWDNVTQQFINLYEKVR